MSYRVKRYCLLSALVCVACGDDDAPAPRADAAADAAAQSDAAPGSSDAAQSGAGGVSGEGGAGGRAGAGGRRSGLSCPPRSNEPVQCGGQTCPTQTEHEVDPCFVPCCVMHEGEERCGFRGTSGAFTTQCVLPAVADPSCDEVPQFQGCCEPTRKVCGIIGGFQPGCQTKSNFVTLPQNPKSCGASEDAGTDDAGM